MAAPCHFISDLAQAEEHFHTNVLRVQPVYEDRSSDLDPFLKENEVGEGEKKTPLAKANKISMKTTEQRTKWTLSLLPSGATTVQGWALNRGLFFVGPPPSLLGAVSGKISEN